MIKENCILPENWNEELKFTFIPKNILIDLQSAYNINIDDRILEHPKLYAKLIFVDNDEIIDVTIHILRFNNETREVLCSKYFNFNISIDPLPFINTIIKMKSIILISDLLQLKKPLINNLLMELYEDKSQLIKLIIRVDIDYIKGNINILDNLPDAMDYFILNVDTSFIMSIISNIKHKTLINFLKSKPMQELIDNILYVQRDALTWLWINLSHAGINTADRFRLIKRMKECESSKDAANYNIIDASIDDNTGNNITSTVNLHSIVVPDEKNGDFEIKKIFKTLRKGNGHEIGILIHGFMDNHFDAIYKCIKDITLSFDALIPDIIDVLKTFEILHTDLFYYKLLGEYKTSIPNKSCIPREHIHLTNLLLFFYTYDKAAIVDFLVKELSAKRFTICITMLEKIKDPEIFAEYLEHAYENINDCELPLKTEVANRYYIIGIKAKALINISYPDQDFSFLMTALPAQVEMMSDNDEFKNIIQAFLNYDMCDFNGIKNFITLIRAKEIINDIRITNKLEDFKVKCTSGQKVIIESCISLLKIRNKRKIEKDAEEARISEDLKSQFNNNDNCRNFRNSKDTFNEGLERRNINPQVNNQIFNKNNTTRSSYKEDYNYDNLDGKRLKRESNQAKSNIRMNISDMNFNNNSYSNYKRTSHEKSYNNYYERCNSIRRTDPYERSGNYSDRNQDGFFRRNDFFRSNDSKKYDKILNNKEESKMKFKEDIKKAHVLNENFKGKEIAKELKREEHLRNNEKD